jgi:hypothetical protein
MTCVAFDLDNTLGYFSHIGVFADFFSVDNLENNFNKILNPKFKLEPELRAKLRTAAKLYIQKISDDPEILDTILRPNLDALILPVIQGKRSKKIRGICIYSNTWNSFAIEMGKEIIEAKYNCKGLFDAIVDASHTIRKGDWLNRAQGHQIKTFKVLKAIFQELCGVKGTINPSDIIFVDERKEVHEIAKSSVHYLKPTEFLPKVSKAILEKIFQAGLDCLEKTGLAKNQQYLESDVFHCIKFGDWGKINTFVALSNFDELIQIAKENLYVSGLYGHRFIDDTDEINNFMKLYS